jgi:hypothetical protein
MNLQKMRKADLIALIDAHHAANIVHHNCGEESVGREWGASCRACDGVESGVGDQLIAVFADWCNAKHLHLSRAQRAVANAVLSVAGTDPNVQKFLLAIGNGRKHTMLMLNLFFGDLAGRDIRWAERNPIGLGGA